jgi:outer membrane protein OmpA-like peptidoglycan-associated protein
MLRRSALLLLVAASLATASIPALGGPVTMGPRAAPNPEPLQDPKPSLQVTIDRSKVDLDNHKLEVKLSRAASKVRIKVLGQSSSVLAEVEKAFDGAAAGTPLVMAWSPSSNEAVAKIEVYGYDTDGYWAGVAIIPWNVSVPHEEVSFENDSDAIRASEVPKLEASFTQVRSVMAKQAELGKIALFIVGHTDTVGSAEHNLKLSRRRARAIAAWFKSKGLTNPVAWEGLGETAPLVKTGDEVAEPRNRRVDYILALEPPKLPSGGDFSWKGL